MSSVDLDGGGLKVLGVALSPHGVIMCFHIEVDLSQNHRFSEGNVIYISSIVGYPDT